MELNKNYLAYVAAALKGDKKTIAWFKTLRISTKDLKDKGL
jgi:hypothetical protein